MSTTRFVTPTLFLLFLAGAAACDGGGGSSGPAADTTQPDAAPAGDAEDDVAVAPAYPPGPYGVLAGEIIEDLGFYDPETEEMVHLHQWYQHPKIKLLMLVSTAAW